MHYMFIVAILIPKSKVMKTKNRKSLFLRSSAPNSQVHSLVVYSSNVCKTIYDSIGAGLSIELRCI